MTESKTKLRLTVLGVLIAFLFVSLSMRMWFLQVLASEEFAHRAESNRVRIVPDPAPRGRILDRDGNVLVQNRSSSLITIDRTLLPDSQRERVLGRLGELLDIDAVELGERLDNPRYYAYEPVPVAFDVPDEIALYVGEHDDQFPGVDVRVGPVRDYPHKAVAAHVLGYTGEISEEELEDPRFARYRQGTVVGKAGVERTYEKDLRGDDGLLNYEVNAGGKVLRTLGVRDPQPGHDLVLSLDLDIQRTTEESLRRGVELARGIVGENGSYLRAGAGAAIVMDPRNGRIVAMSSFPSFNPAKFVGGITPRDLRQLTKPDANFPLLNRAVQSSYPPGSTFKPFVAAAAVRAGITALDQAWDCPAEYSYPGDESGTVFGNWHPADRGFIQLNQALIESCDTVFYQLAVGFNNRRVQGQGEIFQALLRQWGFDRRTGIDLPSENIGRIPDVDWLIEGFESGNPNFRPPFRPCEQPCWLPGDDINMSIGQGNVLTSPLQLAVAFSALANGGTLYEPRLAQRVEDPAGEVVREIEPEVAGKVKYSPQMFEYIREALRYVVINGTAAGAFTGYPHDRYPIAGKTGTAEIDPKQPFSWFAAMSLVPDKPYVVVAVVEEGGHGSQVAAPIVRSIYEEIFGIAYDAPLRQGEETD